MKRFLIPALGFLAIIPCGFAIVDVNENGMSDFWEKEYNNGNLFGASFEAQGDEDGDGWSNGKESVTGTNPMDGKPPAGFLTPQTTYEPSVWVDTDNDGIVDSQTIETAEITWPSLIGKQYQLYGSPDLMPGTWLEVDEPRMGTGGEIGLGIPLRQPDGSVPERLFWRVAVRDVDTDGDGLTDYEEDHNGSNPATADTDGDGLTDSEEAALGTDPNSPDTDDDEQGDAEDAVPLDAEINWPKTPENRYVWIEQVTRTGAKAVSRHGHILFPALNSGSSNLYSLNVLWDSNISDWVSLTGASSWSGSGFLANTAPFDAEWNHIDDMNDEGMVVGRSKWIGITTPGPPPVVASAVMKWQMSGTATDQYAHPIYIVPGFDHTEPYGELEQTLADDVGNAPRIADDGTISALAWDVFYDPEYGSIVYTDWVASNAQVANHSKDMTEWATFGMDLDIQYRSGAVIGAAGGLLVEHDPTVPKTVLHYRNGAAAESLEGLLPSTSYGIKDTDIGRTPVTSESSAGRIWFSVNHDGGDATFLEKRDGGSGVTRWHNPPSMGEGAIRLNARGEAITLGREFVTPPLLPVPPKLWRNGKYTDINDEKLTSKPTSVTITNAIDFASNGIILAQATENGVDKTGLLVPMEMVPDHNRDGMINDEDRGKVTNDKPLVFWINDDDDDNAEPHYGDIPGTQVDGADMVVNSARDLVDFFPVQLRLQEVLAILPADKYTYKLSHPTGAFHFIEMPTVQPDSSPEAQGAGSYLRNSDMADDAMTRPMHGTAGQGAELSAAYLDAAKNGIGVLLFEAASATNQSFELIITKKSDGTEAARILRALPVEMVNNPESMYWQLNLRPVADGDPPGDVIPPVNATFKNSRKDRWFVFCHGYNVSEEAARGWNAETFKRLYQTGFDARFVAVSWQGNKGQLGGQLTLGKVFAPDYWSNVYNAFATSPALASKINALTGNAKAKTVIAGHSLGNMLVGSALCDHGLQAEKYFLLNAAVPREAYLSAHVTTDRNLVRHPDWDTYPTRLWSSDWKNLFPGDGRAGLTWQGRFSNLATKTTPHNFYSTGEEVLMKGTGAMPSTLFDVALQGNLAWIAQEMSKGKATKAFVNLFTTGHWVSNGGWAFNDFWNGNPPPAPNPPSNPDPLKDNPFFKPFTKLKLLNGGAVPDATNGIDLSSPQGGGHAADYSVRAWLLAHDIPAISNPAGSDAVSGFTTELNDSNTDMNENSFKGNGMGDWKHSDLKKQPMDRVGRLFEKMVTKGDLKK